MTRTNLVTTNSVATALITGAGSGIGHGLALALARRGYRLLLAGRDETRLQAVAGEVGHSAISGIYRVDLSDPSARDRLIDSVLSEHGVPHLLINNAATMPVGAFIEHPTAEIEAAVAVNLLAPAVLAQRFCSAPSPYGSPPQGMIFILSTAARFPQPYNSLYSATKSGLRALAESLQVELAGKTRVCLVYPPLTATPMTARFNSSRMPMRKSDPFQVAERIISAYESGRDEIGWLDWEVIPSALYRIAPRLLRWILKSQRKVLQAWLEPPKAGKK